MSSRLTRIALYVLVLLGAFFSLTQLQLSSFSDDPGVGWHLETGRFIFQTGTVPHSDPFLSVARPWISDQWLSDLLFYTVYAQSGWPILYALGIVLYLATFFFVLFKSARGAGYATSAVLLGLLLLSKLSVIHFIFRPVLFSFLLFSLLYAAVVRFARSESEFSISWIKVAFVTVFFALWANLHPSFPLGLLIIAVLACSFVVDKFLALADRPSLKTHTALLLLLASCIGTVLNPFGLELHRSIFALSGNEFFMGLHQEWKPLVMGSAEGELFLMVVGIIIVGLFVYGRQRLRVSTFEFFSTLLFAGSAVLSVRFVPYFAIVASPLLIAVLHETRTIVIEQLTGRSSNPQHGRTRGEGVLFLFSALFLISYTLLTRNVPTYAGHYGPSQSVYPFSALEFLLSRTEESIVVYNHPNWGGFITRYGSGKIRAVLDDRNTLLGETPYREFLESQAPRGNPQSIAKKYNANYVLLRVQDTDKQCTLDNRLEIVYQDSLAVVAAVR